MNELIKMSDGNPGALTCLMGFLVKDVAKLKFKLFESNKKLFFALAITSDIFLAFSIFLKSI